MDRSAVSTLCTAVAARTIFLASEFVFVTAVGLVPA
jgi:hypothetical protein